MNSGRLSRLMAMSMILGASLSMIALPAAACPACVVAAPNQTGIWTAVAFLFPVPFFVVTSIAYWIFKRGHFANKEKNDQSKLFHNN